MEDTTPCGKSHLRHPIQGDQKQQERNQAAVFDPSPHAQQLRLLSIMYHLCGKTFIESSDYADYLHGYPIVLQQPPQHLTVNAIEGLFEIYKVDIQGGLPLDTLFHSVP